MSRTFKVLGVAAVAATAVGLTPLLSFAGDRPTPAAAATIAPGHGPEPGMKTAMRRDLKLSDAQIAGRLRTEASAPTVDRRLRAKLGTSFAGAWIPAGSPRLTVAVTTAAAAAVVRGEGADVKIVARSAAQLETTKVALDKHRTRATRDIHSWYVDVATNTVVISADPAGKAVAEAFIKASGISAGTVRIVASAAAPQPVYDTRGGDQYVINGNTLCSIGFPVRGGFVSAGHCGGVGSATLGYNNIAQGTFAGSSFPGNDYSWIRTNGDWTSRPWVKDASGGNALVAGSRDAAVGSSICRSGRTTGWRCGTLQGRDETVNYSAGAVQGLSRMSACAEPGDSGGSVISGDQAQGVTSGVTGNCTTGGTTWFQPVNEILSTYGLSLTTSGATSVSRLISDFNNKCLDVPGYNYADGQPVDVWDCNNGANQNWDFPAGTVRTQDNKCLDVTGNSTANGAPIEIWNCNGGANQQFVLSAAGDLVNPQANKCVDITGYHNANGATLALWDCNGGANQKWHRG
ncbi:RICIN domain-containing protein [Micromonospora sp. NPDC005220]|uniref:ricin-type beta-trefoil lectin domain protein n=1 Tax=Micromonospora sp. NPDC005220 TaxID=3155589 RepID=UPI0033A47EF4